MKKQTRNRKKIKTEHIKMRIDPKLKEVLKDFCNNNNVTITNFITEAITEKLELFEYIKRD